MAASLTGTGGDGKVTTAPGSLQGLCSSPTCPACFSPESSNNQKLLLEYEKYQELQLKSQRMQEEYEKQLRDNDETKSQALEELTEFYEAKLQEKTTLLEEVPSASPTQPLPPPCLAERAGEGDLGKREQTDPFIQRLIK